MRAGVKVSQMTQISSLLFLVPQISQIYTDFVLFGIESAWYLSEPRCKDTKTVRGNSQLLILAHGCSYFLIDFLCSGICKLVDYGA